ncbi:MAG: DNA internalization-related competence protein ComEC/Rec2 [Bacillota bacterium]
MLKWLLAFVSGLITAKYISVSKLSIVIGLLLILVLIIILLLLKLKSKTDILVLVLIFLCAYCYLQVEKLAWQENNLKELIEKRNEFSGVVEKIVSSKYSTSYIIKELKVRGANRTFDYKIRLTSWNVLQKLDYGDKIFFTTRLRLPPVQKNPGGFCYRSYLKKQGIYALGEIENTDIVKVTKSKNLIVKMINYLRLKIKLIIDHYFQGTTKNLISVLLLGEKNKLEAAITNSFNQLGISHLIVVSGFHMGVISYVLYLILSYLNWHRLLNVIVIALFLSCYLAILNWQLPACRAFLLILLLLCAKQLEKRVDLYNLLAGVALILLVINPWNLFIVSFQMSFAAVVVISYLSPIIKKKLDFLPKKIQEVSSATLAAQLGLFPILIYYFQQISLLAVINNLLLMPLITIIFILALIFVVLNLMHIYGMGLIAVVLDFLIMLTLQLVNLLAQNFKFNVVLAQPSLIIIAAYYIMLYNLAKLMKVNSIPYSKDVFKKSMAIILSITMILMVTAFNNNEDVEVVFLAVGLGDCTYISTRNNKNILIDGGSSAGEINNLLKNRGIAKLDLLFISHFHKDHVGGIIELVKEVKVNKIYCPPTINNKLQSKLKQVLKEKKGLKKLVYLTTGDYLKIDGIEFVVLSPDLPGHKKGELNNNSLVLKMRYQNFKLLLTGDIEKEREDKLIKKGHDLNVDVLKLAHHGSNTSSTKSFLRKAGPSLSIVSVGNNNYGLPDYEVLERLKKLNFKYLRTDRKGAVILKTDGQTYRYYGFLE